ncbi:patatin-like phospholipase domain-containing protein 4 [Nelusetta ayraudi]|uniref:patatin-like phospholipase domain-containing protein 4 n=1 Tax=Nelusetta ayraudi TaxID=303726 RepID=UPI003F6FCB93
MTALNLSFCAAGFLGIYHLGAANAFLRHGDKLLGLLKAYAGASAGALIASLMVTAPDKLEEAKELIERLAENVRKRQFGAVVPGYNLMLALQQGMDTVLPSDAHLLASDRLHVSITDLSGRNHLVSQFSSKDDLIAALLASSYLPFYAGLNPVEFRGQKWIDGGFTDSLPILPVGRTITVSPFAGLQDVCPVHRGRFTTQLRLANMNIMFSMENLKRLNQCLLPPTHGRMQSLYKGGFEDAVRFLRREAWMS